MMGLEFVGAACNGLRRLADVREPVFVEISDVREIKDQQRYVSDRRNLSVDVEDRLAEGLSKHMQGANYSIELIPCAREFMVGEGPNRSRPGVHALAKLSIHGRLPTPLAVQVEAEFAEPYFRQAPLHDIECCGLFTDEQNATAIGKQRGNDVRNRLTLSGTRGAMNDQIGTRTRQLNCAQLAEVGVENSELIANIEQVVQLRASQFIVTSRQWGNLAIGFRDGGAQVTRHAPYQGVLHATGHHAVEVVPHGELGEGEGGHRDCGLDRPVVALGDKLAHLVQIGRDR